MTPKRAFAATAAAALLAFSPAASAQTPASGFALERLDPAPAGAGWVTLDALDMHGSLGGAAQLTTSYARNPLKAGPDSLAVVEHQAFADFGFAVTYERLRLSLDFNLPVAVKGRSGVAAGRAFTGPQADLGSKPDTLSDTRLGFQARLYGGPASAFRLGAAAEVVVPSGETDDYVSDGAYRGKTRVLLAGDLGRFVYAGHLGLHFRALNDTTTPDSPRGTELLYALGGGLKVNLCDGCTTAFILGPELFGATALRSPFGARTTAAEALLSARFEDGTSTPGWRVKLAAGAGLNPHFGAPDWRLAVAFDIFGRLPKL